MQRYEPGEELLDFVSRYVPDFRQTIVGCSQEEVEKLEEISREISGNPVPRFYRWFLETMGSRMGILSPEGSRIDYSAQGVLAAYGSGVVERVHGYLLIGVGLSPFDELHDHLDLRRSTGEDAPLVGFAGDGTSRHHDPEDEIYPSLRERLAHAAFKYECVMRFPILRHGAMGRNSGFDDAGSAEDLDQLLRRLGYERMPITGVYCPMYLRRDAALSLYCPPHEIPDESYAFQFGAEDEREFLKLREILEDAIHWETDRFDHIAR